MKKKRADSVTNSFISSQKRHSQRFRDCLFIYNAFWKRFCKFYIFGIYFVVYVKMYLKFNRLCDICKSIKFTKSNYVNISKNADLSHDSRTNLLSVPNNTTIITVQLRINWSATSLTRWACVHRNTWATEVCVLKPVPSSFCFDLITIGIRSKIYPTGAGGSTIFCSFLIPNANSVFWVLFRVVMGHARVCSL